MLADRYGLALSSTSALACEHYITAVDLILSVQPGAQDALQLALAADPAFAMAHAALARHHQMWGRAADARSAIAQAQALCAGATRREQQHIALQATVIGGNSARALRMLIEHLESFPRDALALGMALGAFGLLAFSGRPDHDAARLVLTERLAEAFGQDWWYLCYRAWAHIEAGSLREGEKYIEQSLALKSDNANGIHVYAHLSYEQHRAANAIDRINALSANYDGKALLHNHLRWHVALGELAAGRPEAALDIYDQYLSPTVATAAPITMISDAVSLLWRVDLAEHQTGAGRSSPSLSTLQESPRWQALRDFVVARQYQSTVAFLDVHVAALFGGASDQGRFDALLGQIEQAMAARRLPAGPAVTALCRAMQAHLQGHAPEAIRLLETHLGNAVRIGGSGAQRDLFEETLALAYACAGDSDAAARMAGWQDLQALTPTGEQP